MQVQELMRIFRAEVDDTVAPYLWSDVELLEYANDAQLEACRRGRLLVDSSTAALCQLAVSTLGLGLLTLDPRVIFVRKIRFAGSLPLRRMTMQDMEARDPFWQDATPAIPFLFVPDYETGKVLLWPPPLNAATALLTVVREPLVEMASELDTPELAPRYHRSLRYWMMVRAYGKQDAQANDPKKAGAAEVAFAREFGAPSSAIDEAWIAREQFEGDGTF